MLELISIHIPKTAGRTFLNILESVYGESRVAHYEQKNYTGNKQSGIEKYKKELTDNTKAIHGHFYFTDIKDLYKPENVKLVTWLRDPVERVISNYSFFKKRIALNPEDIQMQQRKEESLLEYASLENSKNRMSKFVSGIPINEFYFIGIIENFNKDIEKLCDLMNWERIKVPHINDNSSFKSSLPEVSSTDRESIATMNQHDVELYNRVKDLRNINI